MSDPDMRRSQLSGYGVRHFRIPPTRPLRTTPGGSCRGISYRLWVLAHPWAVEAELWAQKGIDRPSLVLVRYRKGLSITSQQYGPSSVTQGRTSEFGRQVRRILPTPGDAWLFVELPDFADNSFIFAGQICTSPQSVSVSALIWAVTAGHLREMISVVAGDCAESFAVSKSASIHVHLRLHHLCGPGG